MKTRDLARTVEFYTELLDFRVETLWPIEEPTFAVLDHGPSSDEVSVSLMFYSEDMVDGEGEPALTGQLTLDVDDVVALHARLSAVVEVLWGPEAYHYGRTEFSVLDPNGYRLVFSAPTAEEDLEAEV